MFFLVGWVATVWPSGACLDLSAQVWRTRFQGTGSPVRCVFGPFLQLGTVCLSRAPPPRWSRPAARRGRAGPCPALPGTNPGGGCGDKPAQPHGAPEPLSPAPGRTTSPGGLRSEGRAGEAGKARGARCPLRPGRWERAAGAAPGRAGRGAAERARLGKFPGGMRAVPRRGEELRLPVRERKALFRAIPSVRARGP